jgi:uncharacterized protein (DUF433 family)
MKSSKTETIAQLPAEIIDRGRGPEIKGTRITVYDVLDYVLEGWSPARIATWFNIGSREVKTAIHYIREHTIEVLTEYVKILERCARGNPPEIQAKLDASHARTQKLMKQIREITARADAEIQELIRTPQGTHAKEGTDGGDSSGQ